MLYRSQSNYLNIQFLDEYLNDYPTIHLLLRGVSGFATPNLYKQCEENGTSYVIRLKENKILREKESFLADALTSQTQNNKVDYAVVYGEFMYKAGSWPYERRVVCKVEKPENQMVCMYTFIVTNMDSSPEYLVKFYCKKGLMENFIKESKSDFDFSAVSSHNRIVNANKVQIHALAYNRQIKINFDGGDLSSDAGLLLIKEFISKLGIEWLLHRSFKTNDSAVFQYHTDRDNLLQMIYMIMVGYFEDDASDELINDPVFKAVLEKSALASQPAV